MSDYFKLFKKSKSFIKQHLNHHLCSNVKKIDTGYVSIICCIDCDEKFIFVKRETKLFKKPCFIGKSIVLKLLQKNEYLRKKSNYLFN